MNSNSMFASMVLGAAVLTAPLSARAEIVRASLSGYEEVPAVSSLASGRFRAEIDEAAGTIRWHLNYWGLRGGAQQAHIHFGQHSVNGGVSAFFCTNLGNGPAGTQACPASRAELTGVISSAAVIGPAVQGINPTEFAELVAAIRSGVAYVNVHSTLFPGGEIRGQIQ